MDVNATQSLALAVGVGAGVTALSARLRIPSVLPLLVVGVLLGSSGLGLVDGESLGSALSALIAVSIGLLIFEGGLHLDSRELSRAPAAVRGLLTLGALVTLVGGALLARYVVGLSWSVSLLLGAVVIVTGPTVVQPILRRMSLTPRLHAALCAEAILIDPVGVIVTVSVLDFVIGSLGTEAASPVESIIRLVVGPALAGLAIGFAVGMGTVWLLRRKAWQRALDQSQLNLAAMGACMVSVGLGEAIFHEAGLVATTICGLVLANAKLPGSADLRSFKQQVAAILVGTLFVLLASRFDLASMESLTWRDGLFVAGLVLLVRPLGVLVSTLKSKMSFGERAFASVFAPRGIVALSVASIAATDLIRAIGGAGFNANPAAVEAGAAVADEATLAKLGALFADASKLESLTFLVIITTVLIASVLGPLMARMFGVLAGERTGVLIIGAHRLGREVGTSLRELGLNVTLVDTNPDRAELARTAGLTVFMGDATDLRWLDEHVLDAETGLVFAWTGNETVDRVVRRWAASRLGQGRDVGWPIGRWDGAHGAPSLLSMLRQLESGVMELRTEQIPEPPEDDEAEEVVTTTETPKAAEEDPSIDEAVAKASAAPGTKAEPKKDASPGKGKGEKPAKKPGEGGVVLLAAGEHGVKPAVGGEAPKALPGETLLVLMRKQSIEHEEAAPPT